MNEYKISVSAHFEKTISVVAANPNEALDKIETALFDTDLVDFSEDDLVLTEAVVTNPYDEDYEDKDEDLSDDCCSDCAYRCPVCGECLFDDED